jgi:hypothetical protein
VYGYQNMLHVWSSEAYSLGFMFNRADEMDILLWAKFEDGDAFYLADKLFLDYVEEEVEH